MALQHTLTESAIREYVLGYTSYLEDPSNASNIRLSRAWTREAPSSPGVYAIHDTIQLIYVGESGNLRGLMTDLLDSRHHQFRRNLGEFLFERTPGYSPASSKAKFPAQIEVLQNDYIEANLRICLAPTKLGRKEIEEALVDKYPKLLNRKAQRKL